jgi:DNA-binding response OmpR family regulator
MQCPSGLTALLVEDEELVRNYIQHVLTQAGFLVLSADSHARALEIFLGERVDFVVADWKLPDKNGQALLDYFQGVRPDLPFLLISGAKPDVPHLAKPFTPTQLITAVWGILGPLPSLP